MAIPFPFGNDLFRYKTNEGGEWFGGQNETEFTSSRFRDTISFNKANGAAAMTATRVKRVDNSEAAIFARVWESNNQGLTPALARHVLKLRFSENDNRRMHELAVKNQSDGLSKEESDELDNFVKVGDLLAILQSKARILLGKKPTPANSHG